MKSLRTINVSAAIIVLVCFFLPWEQVSCAGATGNLSGMDLARHDHGSLWIVPVLMAALIGLYLVRDRQSESKALWLANLISGLVVAYLMNQERMRAHDDAGVISAQLTGWFWFAFFSVFALVASAVGVLLRRQRAP
jgi:cellobiose-specific phosphotransferase system component IIC